MVCSLLAFALIYLVANVESAQRFALMGHREVCYRPDKAAKDERKYRRHNGFKKVTHHLFPPLAAMAAAMPTSIATFIRV